MKFNTPDEILILPRFRMQALAKSQPRLDEISNVISILDPGDERVFKTDTNSRITLFFHDTEYFIDERPSLVLFKVQDAEKILDFVEKMPPKPILYVHCTAGISRSGAVGSFLRRYFDLDYNHFSRRNPHVVPNTHVLRTLAKVWQDRQ